MKAIKRIKRNILIQDFCNYKNEASVLIERNFNNNNIKVICITNKKLINKNNFIYNSANSIITNANYLITKKNSKILKNIMSSFSNSKVIRVDIKYKNENELKEGNLKILEINGVVSSDLRMYHFDNDITDQVYYYLRTFLVRFLMGISNNTTIKDITFNISNNFNSFKEQLNCAYKTNYFNNELLFLLKIFVIFNLILFLF